MPRINKFLDKVQLTLESKILCTDFYILQVFIIQRLTFKFLIYTKSQLCNKNYRTKKLILTL